MKKTRFTAAALAALLCGCGGGGDGDAGSGSDLGSPPASRLSLPRDIFPGSPNDENIPIGVIESE